MTLEARIEAMEDRLAPAPGDDERLINEHVDRIELAAVRDPKVKAMLEELKPLIKKYGRDQEDLYQDPEIITKWRAILELVP